MAAARIARACKWTSARAITRGIRHAVLATAVLSGCYVYKPVEGAARPGMHVALDLNDRGRVALSDSVGPSADRIEGEVSSANGDSSYIVRVASIRYTNGSKQRWTLEPLTVRTDLVHRVREKRFSRARTALITGASTAALVIFAVTVDLFGFGNEGAGGGPGPGPDQ